MSTYQYRHNYENLDLVGNNNEIYEEDVWSWLPYTEEVNAHDGRETSGKFMNEWIVTVYGGYLEALRTAVEYGFKFGGNVKGFPDVYVFYDDDHALQRRGQHKGASKLSEHPQVQWAERLFEKVRVKRTLQPESEIVRSREKRIEIFEKNELHQGELETKKIFNDDMWDSEWYLHGESRRRLLPSYDLNVMEAYQMGFTGSGVRVCVLDDGLEHSHEDLRDNYDPEISWDCNDGDGDPMPRYDHLKRNSHGTRCAGEIAMRANNSVCGVGVAYGVMLGGVRMLDGGVNDRIEGEALGHAWDKIDIYSSSWGPNDDGKTLEGPGILARQALLRGITKGRNGRGSIFVWASGNGGSKGDNCNCDGYASSIMTISISSANRNGLFPWYGEECSSTIATAYSSDPKKDDKIATTDLNNSCTFQHSGTSAAAPLAVGIIALALQANSNLTWRDVQHLIISTADAAPLAGNSGWIKNRAGLLFNSKFGFGLLNAGKMVQAALKWTNVPEQFSCRISSKDGTRNMGVSSNDPVNIEFAAKRCDLSIEHVQLVLTAECTRRGSLEVSLSSPGGTTVKLLTSRERDDSTQGFKSWQLVSLATWRENSLGIWTANLSVKNIEHYCVLKSLDLIIYGTIQQE